MAKKPTSNLEVIEKCYRTLCEMQKSVSLWSDDKSIIDLYNIMSASMSAEIHSNLMAFKSKENEAIIRNLIRRYVVGCKDKGIVWFGALSLIENKLAVLSSKREKDFDLMAQYASLHDDFMALASFRSFYHFCTYLETIFEMKLFKTLGTPQRENIEKKGTMLDGALSGYIYYANQMVLDGNVKFLEKQLPTSYGKSVSDCFMIAWIFGHNINDDVIKVFGNNSNIDRALETITKIMTSSEYAKVFPYYQQFNGKQEGVGGVFSSYSKKDGTFQINGSTKPVNIEIISKDMKRSGIRAKWLFLDDITQAEDMVMLKAHDKDIRTYLSVWEKRRYSSRNFYIVASGTTYSLYDLLTYLKTKFGYDNAKDSKINKWTKVGVSNALVDNGMSVFVCVPKLDYETDESTFPEEYGTLQARKMREEEYELFMAMEQQMPQKPKDSPFYYTQLQEYEDLPQKGTSGRSDSCWAYLDGKRKGSDYCAMPIFTPINDSHYLIDAFYDNRPMKECYNGIVAKIKQHRITRLVIENNINEGLKTLLDKMLSEQGVTFCKIEEVFNTVKKDVRIANAEADIKAFCIFPKIGLYARSSPIGQAMDEVYGYSYVKAVTHDDFIDAVAGYVESFISKKNSSYGTVSAFSR